MAICETDEEAAFYDWGYADRMAGKRKGTDNPHYDAGYVAAEQAIECGVNPYDLRPDERLPQ